MAASATFALNAELCVRRARLAIVTPDLRHSRRLQAETPLTDLSEFGQPALASRFWPLVLLPSHQETGSCSSAQKPVSNSRPLYAGRRPLSHQAPRGLISGEKSAPDFDDT